MRDEEKSKIHADRGLAFTKDGLWDKAIDEFKVALGYAPDNISALTNLATALKQKGHFDEAISILESVLNQDWRISNEGLGIIYYNLGNTYRDKKLEEKAIAQYKKAIEVRPNHASTWYNLGQSYFAIGELENAARSYEKALENNPSHSEARLRLDLINELKESGELDEVKKELTRPENEYDKLLIEGERYRLEGKLNSAVEQFKEAMRRFPDEGEIYIRLAKANLELMKSKDSGDSEAFQENLRLLEKAEDLINSGKSKKPMDMYNGLTELYDAKARCFSGLGQYEQAVKELEKALEIDPDKEESRSTLTKTRQLITGKKEKSEGQSATRDEWKQEGPHAFGGLVKGDLEYPGMDTIISGKNALGCLRCNTVIPLNPCSNCGHQGYHFGLDPDRILGLFCSRCKQGFTSRECSCGCKNPISNETILKKKGGGCFIITAACGNIMAPEVIFLSSFRDQVLNKTIVGQKFVHIYYAISPYFAEIISKSRPLRTIIRVLLVKPLISLLRQFL